MSPTSQARLLLRAPPGPPVISGEISAPPKKTWYVVITADGRNVPVPAANPDQAETIVRYRTGRLTEALTVKLLRDVLGEQMERALGQDDLEVMA